MPSADQLLRLLEEKDLVPPQVLQAARLEVQRTSPPPDAVAISLWLVQGQHITATQAERLLAALAEKSDNPPQTSRWFKGEAKPADVSKSSIPLPAALERFAQRWAEPSSPAAKSDSPPGQPKPPTASQSDDLELAPLAEEDAGPKKAAKLSSSATQEPGRTAPSGGFRRRRPESPSAATAKPGESPKPADVGHELDSLETTMKGPLDALIESEVLAANPLDDPSAAVDLGAARPKKFKLRRFLKNLFRRDKSKVVKIKAIDPRQVKLVLFSWGVAIFAILAVLVLLRLFSKPDPAEILRKADAAATKEDYGQAIAFYDEYLTNYPKTDGSDEVRGLRILAELRKAIQAAGASGDWTPAFQVADAQCNLRAQHDEAAKAQLEAVLKNSSPELQQRIGIALAQIGEGLAKQVQPKPDMDAVNHLTMVVKMIEGDIPADLQPGEMLEGINHALKQCRQAVYGAQEIKNSVAEIRRAVDNNDLPAAYAAYKNTVQSYPDLADQPELAAAMKLATAVELQAVKTAESPLTVMHADRPSDLLAAMPLAVQPIQAKGKAAQDKQRFVVAQGTAYGLNAATGKVLWRRFVAGAAKGRELRDESPEARRLSTLNSQPSTVAELAEVAALPVAGPSQNDLVLCDPVHEEVLRVKGSTGELLWRLALGRAIAARPVQAGKSLLLLTQDQRLLFIDLATGASTRYLQLPQAVRLPPVVDEAHGLVFLVAEESNIYVLSHGACSGVFHLGHDVGAVAAAPTVIGNFLAVPVNDSPNEATVRVLSINASSADEPLKAVQRLQVKGHVDTSPVVVGSGVVIVTSQGGMAALEPECGKGDSPLAEKGTVPFSAPFRMIASVVPASDEKAVRFAVSDGRSFWVTGPQLTRYSVDVKEGRISPQAESDQGMKFVATPSIEDGTMFSVVERPGLPGVTVSAVDLSKNETAWQTWLAAPLAGEPMLGAKSGKLTAVTSSGGMFRFPPEGLRAGAAPSEPVLCVGAARLTKPLSSLLALPDERFAMTSGASTTQIVIYDPQEQDKRFRWLVSPQNLTAPPGSFAGGVLAPSVSGQVYLLDLSAREEMLAKPYEMSLRSEGVSTWRWRTPQAADDDKLAVLCDGDRRIVTIHITGDDVPTLTEAKVVMSKLALVSPIAVLQKTVYVVDEGDNLLSLELPELTPGKTQALGGHCMWGPQRVGKLVLVATDKKLFAVNERQQTVWQTVLPYGPLAGAPCAAGDDIYLSSTGGIVWRISAADGKEQGKVDAGCPLGTGPLVIGRRVIVGGHEGSLLEVKKP